MRSSYSHLFAAAVVTICIAASGCALSHTEPSAAQRYVRSLHLAIDGIESDLPGITAIAEAAADRYVQDNGVLAIHGDTGFFREAVDRSGGIMRTQGVNHASGPTGVVLFCVNDRSREDDLKSMQYAIKRGAMIIAFGRDDQLDALRERDVGIEAFISCHAPPGSGIFTTASGKTIIPVHRAANITAMWVWTGEFVAALTRRGRMPPMYQGFAVPGGHARLERIGRGTRFHDETPVPIDAGRVGMQYLKLLRADLRKVQTREMSSIRAAAKLAHDVHANGGHAYAFMHGHVIGATLEQPGDPHYFEVINATFVDLRKNITLQRGDVVFCVGYDQPFDGEWFKHFATRARADGVKLIWSMTDYKPDLLAALPDDEIVINQHWAFGDAVVPLPGYDVKILPTSGVISEAIVWMVHAEMMTLRGDEVQPLH